MPIQPPARITPNMPLQTPSLRQPLQAGAPQQPAQPYQLQPVAPAAPATQQQPNPMQIQQLAMGIYTPLAARYLDSMAGADKPADPGHLEWLAVNSKAAAQVFLEATNG